MPRQYIRYAIGEILLVVIGILIALQINNWNEDRKLYHVETRKLHELAEGLEDDLEDINLNISIFEMAIESGNILLEVLQREVPYHDSLATHFAQSNFYARFIVNSGPYESLKNEGLELISNQMLRKKISYM